MKTISIFLFYFFYSYSSTLSEEYDINFKLNDLTEKSLGISCIYSLKNNSSSSIVESILNAIVSGGQVSFSKIEIPKNFTIEWGNKLLNKSYLFYFLFEETDEFFIWKLYDLTNNLQFIKGKKYLKDNSKRSLLVRHICKDIWKDLFGNDITPFDYYLTFLIKNSSEKYKSIITYLCPFINDYGKKEESDRILLRTSRNFINLYTLDTKPNKSLICSEITNTNVKIIKLNMQGNISSLIDLKGTLSSLITNKNGVWYINSGKIYRSYFDKEKSKLIHICLTNFDFNGEDSITAKISVGPNNSILLTQNFKTYIIDYIIDEKDNCIINNKKKLSPNNVKSVSITYNEKENIIVTSEKINNYYQLVSYDGTTYERNILTESKFNKQDPSISPCGAFVAYIIYNGSNNKTSIELYNLYTKKIISVTKKQGYYLSPAWITR